MTAIEMMRRDKRDWLLVGLMLTGAVGFDALCYVVWLFYGTHA
jgi:hypothetical protein